MKTSCRVRLVVGGAALTIAACNGDASSLTVDQLREAGDSCPVGLAAALDDAGLVSSGTATVQVNVAEEGVAADDMSAAALDRAGGVHVECSQPLGDGQVVVELLATQVHAAANLLLPQLARDLDLSTDDLEPLLERIQSGDEGSLVDLPGDAPVALARVAIDGAESATAYVSGSDGPSREQVEALAGSIVDHL